MIYEIHTSGKEPPHVLETSKLSEHGWREQKLQDYLFRHLPELVSTDLMVISQSVPGEHADLVALDCDGDLWIFELKAVGGESENLLQVMRYSQIFGGKEIDDLDKLYRTHSGSSKSLALDFCEWFGYDSDRASAWGEKLGKHHHLVVMTDGTDDDTLNAVAHWQKHGLDIQAWPYRIYKWSKESLCLDVPELFISGKRISQKQSPVFFVNTSRKTEPMPSAIEKFMLEHECALATGDSWVPKIFRIPSGAKVMLYANRVGIIATGIATPAREITDLEEFPDEKACVLRLRDFRKLKSPLSVQDVFRVAKKTYRVATVYEPQGEAGKNVWEAALRQP